MLGLKRGTVKLASKHDKWKQLFEEEKKILLETFGHLIIDIEHVGSTAIPGVPAKPLIDMNIAISSLNDEYIKKFVAPLKKIGYHYMHKFPERRFFAKGPETKRTHHLNLVELNSNQWRNSIIFRNYMRRNKPARDEYAALKKKLAKQFPEDRTSYTKEKEKFIEKIIKQATT